MSYKDRNSGFTLVEMAIVLAIVGIIVAPAVGIYNLYQKNQRLEQTDFAMEEALNAINGFRTVYGRYPCPARMDAVPGDVDYGYEFVDAAGDCDDGAGQVEVANSVRALPDDRIFIGSLPFRQINLPFELSHDGYRNRLTYAVTGLQTDDDTYESNNGGISIIDYNGVSAIDPADSGHFVIVSHGEQFDGAVNYEGQFAGACLNATLREQTNCNFSEAFRIAQKFDDFDDSVMYAVADNIEHWQIQRTNDQNIHLRRSLNIAMGPDASDPVVSFSSAEIQTQGSEDGTVKASSDITFVSTTGTFQAVQLCDDAATNCFEPNVVGGQIADGEGMECPPATPYLVGIAGSAPICVAEVEFNCPAGDYVTGFDPATGELQCSTIPAGSCSDSTVTTACGDSRNITGFWDDGTMYAYAYTGECYNIDGLDTVWLDAQTSLTDISNYVDGLNNAPRTQTDCGTSITDALVRETYECSAGSWSGSPVRSIERWDMTPHNLSHPPTTGGNTSEVPGPAFTPATPMSVDPNNSSGSHDCWCREDYLFDTESCPGPATGNRFRILEHRCPATRQNRWQRAYPASSGWDTRFCGCSPYSDSDTVSCASYFGYTGPSGGITGNVIRPYDVSCPSGPTGSPVTTYTGADDISACLCPANPTSYATTNCPPNTTNSFVYDGITFTNKSQVRKREWTCPGGPAPQPATSAADAGSYSIVDTYNEACVCDATATTMYHEACPAGEQGTGTTWELAWDCATSTWEAPSATNLVSEDCHTCVWQTGTPRPGIQSIAAPEKAGAACASCSGSSSCYLQIGENQFTVWDGCYCAGQP